MNWCDERYVRLYTRDTADFLALSFEAQGLLSLLLRKFDRAGVLELGKHGKRAVAIAIGHASRWETLEPALDELLADGCVVLDGNRLVMPNFVDAQEAVQSDRLRQAESRARRRELTHNDVTNRDSESRNVTKSHAVSQPVTRGHAVSQNVTPSVPSVPSLPNQPTQGSLLRSAFVGWYSERYGGEYVWSAKEATHAKTLMQRAGEKGVAEVLRRASIAAGQGWRQSNVTLGAVVEAWNSLAVESLDSKKPSPAEEAERREARRLLERL